jgi:hypothetical protein
VLRLDDLAAAAWWECQRADGTEPFTSVFARDCEAVLDRLAANRQTQTRTEGQTL